MTNVTRSSTFTIGVATALLFLGGLSIYTWNLHAEVEQLRSEINQSDSAQSNRGSTGSSIFDPFGQGPLNSRGLLGQDPFAQLRQTMDNLMFGNSLGSSPLSHFGHTSPKIHIDETGPDYLIRIEVPEHQELELNTEVDGDLFRVTGVFKNQEDLALDGSNFYRSSESRFSRSFLLRNEVDESKMIIENTGNEVVIRLPKVA